MKTRYFLSFALPIISLPFLIFNIYSESLPLKTVSSILIFLLFYLIIFVDKKLLKENSSLLEEKENESMPVVMNVDSENIVLQEEKSVMARQSEELLELEEKYNLLLELHKVIAYRFESFPVLAKQLSGVIKYTDQATGELIGSFYNINMKAKEQATNVARIFHHFKDEDIVENEQILQTNKKVLHSTIANTKHIISTLKKLISGIKGIKSSSEKIDGIVDNLKKIAEQTKIISLNALIEAARAGEKGKGFSVVAKEVKKLSEQSTNSANEISLLIGELVEKCNRINDETSEEYNNAMEIFDTSQVEVSNSLDKIDETLLALEDKLQIVSKGTESLSKEINRIIVSIQFQDITRQRIEHVIEPLELIYKEMQDKLAESKVGSELREEIELDRLKDWLNRYYTIEDEKVVLNSHFND